MRASLIVFLFCFSLTTSGQSNAVQSIEKVKAAIEKHAPCNTSMFCFEYFLQVNEEKKELEIKTLRYNYQGNPRKKVLTETRICKIAVEKIKAATFYPGDEQSFLINAKGIDQELNGKKEIVESVILDFNEDFIGKSQAFQKAFGEMIAQLKEN